MTQTHLPQLLMNTQVVHHHDAIQYLQQGLVCHLLVRLIYQSPQQQAVITVATLNFGGKTEPGRNTTKCEQIKQRLVLSRKRWLTGGFQILSNRLTLTFKKKIMLKRHKEFTDIINNR